MALRVAILRVRGVQVEKKASSHALATSMEKFQVVRSPRLVPAQFAVRFVHVPV
jgi:hypothetical protein